MRSKRFKRFPGFLVSGALLLALLLPALPAAADETPRPLRFPDIHRDFVVFAYAGDLWRASTDGGTAHRLTAHEGLELFPKISPDGRWIAFSGEYSGARQVYVMPAEGGPPRQLTFYTDVGDMPARGGWDYWVLDWTPDGEILVRCNRTPWGERMGRYCLVDPEGGLETYLPLPEGGGGTLSPDGKKLVYAPVSREFRTWKRTRGGRAQDIWIYDLEAKRSERLTTDHGTDNFPMWSGETIYFTSDRADTLNLFAHDLGTGEKRQVTNFDTYDVLWPALGPEAIVFQNGGHLHRYDLASGETRQLEIEIASDLPWTVPHFEDVSDDIAGASISPSGSRVVFDTRGELFSVPRIKGPTRNLTATSGVRETDPAWSPDGHWIAYFSDVSGEYELYVRPAGESRGEAGPRQITSGGDVWLMTPVWSPDASKIAWSDKKRRLRAVDVATGDVTNIDTGLQGDITSYSFSPDGRFIVYEKAHGTGMQGISVYSFESGEPTALGDGLTNDFSPAWSADGEHLFFLSNRDYQLRFSAFEFNYVYDRATRVYAAALHRDAPALFPFESDEETGTEDAEESGDGKIGGGKNGINNGNGNSKKEITVTVEADGFVERTIALPGVVAAGYLNLAATEGAVFYLKNADDGLPELVRYDLEKREEATVMKGAAGFELTPDGSKLLYAADGAWGVADAQPNQNPEDGKLDLSGLHLKLDPREEWAQIFADGWRITRDFFYDPDMHGVDWPAMRERYGDLLPGVGHRDELDFLLGEMVSELEAGHTYVMPGDEPHVERVEGGKLGAELELDAETGRFRIARILNGENWDETYRSPLTEPGVNVREGDYLLAIDGTKLHHPDNPYRLLEGKAGKQVTLLVGAEPTAQDAREEIIRPIANEGNLRYIDWVKSRMELVDRLSGGKIGYIHLPNTAIEGNRMLQKLFYAQVRKPALLVDERYNGGGFIPDRMIEYLERDTLAWWARRDVESFQTPGFAHDGPKAMLINGYSSSGGDALPYFFKKKGLGPLIGTRTWGGLIGITGAPPLVDGGVVLPPTFRIYDENGEWVVENEGVPPDIEVIDLPEEIMAGNDPSIEKAVEVLLEELEKGDVSPPDVPEPPDMTAD